MRLRKFVFGSHLAVGVTLAAYGVALANGGDEAEHAITYSPLALVPAGLSALVVGYLMFRVFRGR